MNKHLIYYLYCNSYKFLEVYALHFNCINSYNDIFDKYTFILAFDNINDNDLINYWKNIVKTYIKTDKEIEFIIVANNPIIREGIHFYNYVFKRLNKFNNELILWAHGKCDLNFNKDYIYSWITLLYYQLSFVGEIEDYLINDKYCHVGGLLTECISNFTNVHYSGSFYWIYPDKILSNYKDRYNIINHIYDNYINNLNVEDNIIYYIRMFAENWFNLFFNKNDFKTIGQKNILVESLLPMQNDMMMYFYQSNNIYKFNIYLNNIIDLKGKSIFYDDFLDKYSIYKETMIKSINIKDN